MKASSNDEGEGAIWRKSGEGLASEKVNDKLSVLEENIVVGLGGPIGDSGEVGGVEFGFGATERGGRNMSREFARLESEEVVGTMKVIFRHPDTDRDSKLKL